MASFSSFIAFKLGKNSKGSFSNLIVKVAVVAISLSMMVMILSTAIVRGFKHTISEKIFGFWGHIHLTGSLSPSHLAFEAMPISQAQVFYPALDTIRSIPVWRSQKGKGEYLENTQAGVRHIQTFANKEGIIKTDTEIEGIILRGIAKDYDWGFLQKYLLAGTPLVCSDTAANDGIIISETTSKRLKKEIGDTIETYFVQAETSLARRFRVHAIYKTGLEEYDKRFALVDIAQIQQLNNWRPYHNYPDQLDLSADSSYLIGFVDATLPPHFERVLIEGKSVNWDEKNEKEAVVSQQLAQKRGWKIGDSISLAYKEIDDSTRLRFKIVGIHDAQNLSDSTNADWTKVIFVSFWQLQTLNRLLAPQVSGFEIFLDNIADLSDYGHYINNEVLTGKGLYAATIKELEPSIFDWLELTDINEQIILILMILVAVINMITSLLILILERTNMIGTLKALGATNWQVRQLFLWYAAYIIGWGMIWGNGLGLGLCALQAWFGIITLPEDLYYVKTMPIRLEILPLLYINLGTFFVTLLVLILPSYLVSRIEPVKAIRFK